MLVRAEGASAWRRVLSDVEARLESEGFLPQEARWLIEEVTGIEDERGLDSPITKGQLERLDSLLSRRLAGEPLQYVLGRWSFRGLDLMVDHRVLIPRPETEVVAGHALEECRRVALTYPQRGLVTVADLGCGSGAIGLSLASEYPLVRVWCTDVCTEALAVARANLAGIGSLARRVTLVQGSWFGALPDYMAGCFDVLVSNPPYVAVDESLPDEVSSWEPQMALRSGVEGIEDLCHLIDEALGWLANDGALVLEIPPLAAPPLDKRARVAGFCEVHVFPDLTGRDRVLVARKSK